jgi:hypothetical protein
VVSRVWPNTTENSDFGFGLDFITKFLSNLPHSSKVENSERDGLDLLQMTRDTQRWWWHSKIKRFAKVANWDDLSFASKSHLGLSIVLNLG